MRLLLPLFLLAPAVFAQTAEFDVASIKPFTPAPNGTIMIGPLRGGPGTADPTHIVWPAATLRQVLATAYDVKNYQIGGPDTLDSQRYDFAVGVPAGATKDQVALMWRNLLETRFGMKLHIDQKEFQVDELTIGPKGHKLIESTSTEPERKPDPNNPPPPPGPMQMDKDGKPVMNGPGLMMMMGRGNTGITARVQGKAQPMSALINMIANQLGHPILDKTGLTGKYDFYIEYFPTNLAGPGGLMLATPAGAPPPPSNSGAAPDLGLDLDTAIQQQLGLKLTKGKGKLDYIVVDKYQPTPTEN